MARVSFRVIHFNNGMHGWKYSDEQYAASLPPTVAELHRLQRNAGLIWASTTPVRSDADGATNARIEVRNRAADEVMRSFKIPIDDQHALMESHRDLHLDDVHWNEPGSDLQAAQVADTIRRQLQTP